MKLPLHFNITGRLLLAAALVVLPISGYAASGEPIVGTTQSVSGKPDISINGSTKPLAVGDKLPPGCKLTTHETCRVVISTLPNASVRIDPKSEFVIDSMEQVKDENGKQRLGRFNLKSGGVYTAISKAGQGVTTDYRIKTPNGIAAARGTKFYVSSDFVICTESSVDLTFFDAAGNEIGKLTIPAGFYVNLSDPAFLAALNSNRDLAPFVKPISEITDPELASRIEDLADLAEDQGEVEGELGGVPTAVVYSVTPGGGGSSGGGSSGGGGSTDSDTDDDNGSGPVTSVIP